MSFRHFILSTAVVFFAVSCLCTIQTASAQGHANTLSAESPPDIANAPINRSLSPIGRGVAGGGAEQQSGQQQAGRQQVTAGRGAAAAGGGAGGGGGGATYKHNEAADKSMEYGKQARESVQKSLDKFGEGVKSLADGFKESLAAVSKLAEDNQENMKDLRKNIEAIAKRSAEPVGAEAVAKLTEEVDKHGQTLVDIVTKRAQSFASIGGGAKAPISKGQSIQQALGNQGGGGGGGTGGLELAGNASVPNANQVPSFNGSGSTKPGAFGGASVGFKASDSPSNSLDFSLREKTYNPPSIR